MDEPQLNPLNAFGANQKKPMQQQQQDPAVFDSYLKRLQLENPEFATAVQKGQSTSPTPYWIGKESRGPLPSAQEASIYTSLNPSPKIEPEVPLAPYEREGAARESQYQLSEKEKPGEKLAESNIKDTKVYQQALEDAYPEVSRSAEAASKAFKDLPQRLEEFKKENPHLSRADIEKEYGFGRKLIASVLGGIGGKPNLANEAIDRKFQEAENAYKTGINDIMQNAEVAAKDYEMQNRIYETKNTQAVRSLEAAKAINQAEASKTADKLQRLDRDAISAQLQQKIDQVKITNQKIQRANADANLIRTQELANNPLAIKLPTIDPVTGDREGVIANSKEDYTFLTSDDKATKMELIFGKNGLATRFINGLEKRGTERSDAETVNLFNQIAQVNPFKLEADTNGTFQVGKKYNSREMIEMIKDLDKYWKLTLQQRTHKPTLTREQILDIQERAGLRPKQEESGLVDIVKKSRLNLGGSE